MILLSFHYRVGLYLTDVVYVTEGNPDKIGDMINFDKYVKLAHIVEDIHRLQVSKHNFMALEEVQLFFKQQLKDSRDIQELHDLSQTVEPRERTTHGSDKNEADRVLHLMMESGFF